MLGTEGALNSVPSTAQSEVLWGTEEGAGALFPPKLQNTSFVLKAKWLQPEIFLID